MSISAILIIIFVIAMLAGPVFMLQPSKRQRHLAQTRTAAAEQGLRVRMARVPDKTATRKKSVAVYTRSWPNLGDRHLRRSGLLLIRSDYSHELHVSDHWAVESGELPLDDPLRTKLEGHLNTLPASILGIEISASGVGAYWSEQEGQSFLPKLGALLEDLSVALVDEFHD